MIKCILSVSIVCALVLSDAVLSGAANAPLKEQYEVPSFNGVSSSEDTKWYSEYFTEKSEDFANTENQRISVDISASGLYKTTEDGVNAVVWSDNTESVEFYFEVPEKGFYELEIKYLALESTSASPRRNIMIDGEKLYREMDNVEFPRMWQDDGKPFKNPLGDEVRPQVKEIYEWQTMRVVDLEGLYDSPLKFALDAGKHKLTLSYVYEPMAISGITFVSPEVIPSYEEVKKEYEEKGYEPVSDSPIKIDAEFPEYKSDSSLRMQSCADPAADPNPKGQTVFNVLGGGSWNKANQAATYSFDVKKSGLYRINLRVYQKYGNGLPVYREIKIDGEVPFSEFKSFEIEDTKWVYESLKNGEEPFLIYLEKGKHTITLTAKLTGYSEILRDLNKSLSLLSYAIRKITMVTSVSPDTSLDYKLDEKIPDLMDTLKALSDNLEKQINVLKSMTTTSSTGAVSGLAGTKLEIDNMIKNPSVIPANLSRLTEAQVSLSSWVTSFSTCDLQLDYIEFADPQTEPKNYSSNIFQILYYSFKTFLNSFVKDYNSITGLTGTENGEPMKSVSVWISRGKDWGDILKQICDEDFAQQYNTEVKLNILPSGQLGATGIVLMAIASGTAPDVILGGDGSLATEYGMRDASVDLTQFEDFEEVSKEFLPGVFNSYTYKDGIYALPETIDFSVMYYRSDILEELNMKIPETWDDVRNYVLPVLKKNGMDFWYEGGYNTFLFQNGGDYYKDGGKASALDTQEAIDAFKQFTDLYKVYEVPVQADFYSRFRTGQIPIGISSFNTYIKLTSAAPEIQGKWGVAQIPGQMGEDGVINRSSSGVSTGCIILSNAADKEASWDFIKWYTSSDAQERYTRDLAAFIGPEARWCSANIKAFDSLSWENNLKEVITEQRKWYKDQYNVVGGYITARHVENARVRCVVEGMNYRESLEIAVDDINRELNIKNQEFDKREQLSK